MFGIKTYLTLVAVAVVTLAFEAPARAQSPAPSRDDDPVASAMERIHSAVERRAAIADRVMAASKLLDESKVARKRGEVNALPVPLTAQPTDQDGLRLQPVRRKFNSTARSGLMGEVKASTPH